MYIPLAVHKNELVVIDSMETFSHYFCLAKKQKMTPLASGSGAVTGDEDMAEESGEFFEESSAESASDEDDDL